MSSTTSLIVSIFVLLYCSIGPNCYVFSVWHPQWDLSQQFNSKGIEKELFCGEDNLLLPTECCVCNLIGHSIGEALSETKDDHPMDVVFRVSEEKKSIMYSRSEGRILEVLDSVCSTVKMLDSTQRSNDALHDDTTTVKLESTQKKTVDLVNSLIKATCTEFVQVFEDSILKVFYDDPRPSIERLCTESVQVCSVLKDEL